MSLSDQTNRRLRVTVIAITASVIAIEALIYLGAPIPGHYQIVGGGRGAVTMVDTITGKIWMF